MARLTLTEARYEIAGKLEPQELSSDTLMLEKYMTPDQAAKLTTKKLFNKAAELQNELLEAGIHSDISLDWNRKKHMVTVTVLPNEDEVKQLKERVGL